jgi:hypothetical protein
MRAGVIVSMLVCIMACSYAVLVGGVYKLKLMTDHSQTQRNQRLVTAVTPAGQSIAAQSVAQQTVEQQTVVSPSAMPPATPTTANADAALHGISNNMPVFGMLFSLFTKKDQTPSNWDDLLEQSGNAFTRGDYGRAKKYLRIAVKMAESQDPNDLRIATTAAYLANIDEKTGDLAEAETCYRKALAVDVKHLPSNHPDVVQIRSDLTSVLRREEKYTPTPQRHIRATTAIAPVGLQRPVLNAPLNGP